MIRLIRHTDADQLFALVSSNRAYLRRWLPWLDFNQALGDTKAFIANSLKDYAENKSMVQVIVAEGRVVGVCGFNSLNHTIRAGWMGYWVAESQQGKGYAWSACRDLEHYGFDALNLNKIEIHVALENTRSRRLAERLGYTETGRIVDAEWLYDHYVDHVIYCKRYPAHAEHRPGS